MQTKTIGLLGGIGWASAAEYYRLLNETAVATQGDAHSARIVLLSMDQCDFTSRAAAESPALIENFLIEQVARLHAAGADFFVLCANGAHRFVPAILPHVQLPFISIVDATAKQVQAAGIGKVGLLGVKQTMAGRFYHDRLEADGIAVLTPQADEQQELHDLIYAELVHNRITAAAKQRFLQACARLIERGAQGIILGCTEIPLLLSQEDVAVPVFNTTAIHCAAIIDAAFSE